MKLFYLISIKRSPWSTICVYLFRWTATKIKIFFWWHCTHAIRADSLYTYLFTRIAGVKHLAESPCWFAVLHFDIFTPRLGLPAPFTQIVQDEAKTSKLKNARAKIMPLKCLVICLNEIADGKMVNSHRVLPYSIEAFSWHYQKQASDVTYLGRFACSGIVCSKSTLQICSLHF